MTDKNKTEIAEPKSTAMGVFDDDLLSEGTGLEETTADDFAIPFIRVLQNTSPQLIKNNGKYIEGASAGDLLNTVTNEAYDGVEGLSVIPCAYTKKYIEWIPREKGGGLVNANHTAEILHQCKRDEESRRYYLSNGNEIVETAQFSVLAYKGDEAPSQAVCAFTSTQLGAARKWLTMLRMARVQNSKGQSVQAPMFAYTYKLTTTSQSNDKGSWQGYSVNQEGPTSMELALVAKEFMTAARQGEVEVKHEQTRDDSSSAQVIDDEL